MSYSDRLKQAGKYLGNKISQNNYNTNRVRQIKPKIERKLDIISQDYSFHMPFKTTSGSSRIMAVIRFKPDNCCECDAGAQTVARDVIATFRSDSFGPSNGTAYPARIAEPLEQTGTKFNYGYSSPFFHPTYMEYPDIADYEIAADGEGIVVPVDGVYTMVFEAYADCILDLNSYVRLQIRRNGTEILSEKIYSLDTVVEDGGLKKLLFQYALCRPLKGGDTVNAWVKALTPSMANVIDLSRSKFKMNLWGLGWAIIKGRVYDEATGDGISGATVSYSEGFGGYTTTDVDGNYVFTMIRPATYSLTASSSGYNDMTRITVAVMGEITIMDFNLTQV